MWHIDPPSQETLDKYKEDMLPGLKKRIKESSLNESEKSILLTPAGAGVRISYLETLLIANPNVSFQLAERIMANLFDGYSITELQQYANYIHLLNPTVDEQQIINKYQLKLNNLLKIFDYEGQLGGNKSRAYRLTAQANHNTCVYCNRQYTFNIVKNGGKNNHDRLVRPALDHWFPKSLFPLLSLNYYNLIPSCTICNSSAKGDHIFLLEDYIHPYMTINDDPGFKFHYKKDLNEKWEIYLDDFTSVKERNTANAFALCECYQCHANLEVADLIELARKNNGTYLKMLFREVLHNPQNMMTPKDVYRMLLGTEYDAIAYKNRPLSKLKRDILEQIEGSNDLITMFLNV